MVGWLSASWHESISHIMFWWPHYAQDSVFVVLSLSHVPLFVTPWTVAHQAPLSVGFFKQEYWNGLSFPSPGDLPNPGIKPTSLALSSGFFTTEQDIRGYFFQCIMSIVKKDIVVFLDSPLPHKCSKLEWFSLWSLEFKQLNFTAQMQAVLWSSHV